MPITGTYTWKQTPQYIHLSVPLKGTSRRDVDVYVSPLFIKINFAPYLVEIDLLHQVQEDATTQAGVVKQGQLVLRLQKAQAGAWPTLTVTGLDKKQIRERRAKDIEEKRHRDIEIAENARLKRGENERKAVRVQMQVDETEHSTLDTLKAEEKQQAEEETYKVLAALKKKEVSDATAKVKSQTSTSTTAAASTSTKSTRAPSNSHAAQQSQTVNASGNKKNDKNDDDDNIDDSDIMRELEVRRSVPKKVTHYDTTKGEIWSEKMPEIQSVPSEDQSQHKESVVDDDLDYVPEPRQTGGVVKMSFTKRFFKTPLRESKRAEEEDWIAKNQRGLSNHPDARDIAERDPFWLKGKGDDFFKCKDYLGAINAYSAALQAQPKMFAALSNRAAAYLAVRRFDKSIDDATAALAVVESETDSKVKCLKLWVRRGTAFCGKGEYDTALKDYEMAQQQLPKDLKIKSDILTIKRLKKCASLKKQADALFRQQKHDEACKMYGEALSVDSGFVSCYTNRAAASLATQSFEQCISDTTTALELLGIEDRNRAAGDNDEEEDNPSETSPSTKRAKHILNGASCTGPVPAEGTPKYSAWLVNIYVKRGVALARKGDLKLAESDYVAALKLAPSNKDVKQDLKRLRRRMKRIAADELNPEATVKKVDDVTAE